jgi:hypothetical protein
LLRSAIRFGWCKPGRTINLKAVLQKDSLLNFFIFSKSVSEMADLTPFGQVVGEKDTGKSVDFENWHY